MARISRSRSENTAIGWAGGAGGLLPSGCASGGGAGIAARPAALSVRATDGAMICFATFGESQTGQVTSPRARCASKSSLAGEPAFEFVARLAGEGVSDHAPAFSTQP